MDSRELRLGNLVMVNNKVVVVDTIDVGGINLYIDPEDEDDMEATERPLAVFKEVKWENGDLMFDVVMPIPLTEEWAIKLGFIKEKPDSIFDLAGIYNKDIQITYQPILYPQNKTIFEFTFKGCFHSIKYVHQLQNLYFSLTGKELTLNPSIATQPN